METLNIVNRPSDFRAVSSEGPGRVYSRIFTIPGILTGYFLDQGGIHLSKVVLKHNLDHTCIMRCNSKINGIVKKLICWFITSTTPFKFVCDVVILQSKFLQSVFLTSSEVGNGLMGEIFIPFTTNINDWTFTVILTWFVLFW